jgi:hypothetical protein
MVNKYERKMLSSNKGDVDQRVRSIVLKANVSCLLRVVDVRKSGSDRRTFDRCTSDARCSHMAGQKVGRDGGRNVSEGAMIGHMRHEHVFLKMRNRVGREYPTNRAQVVVQWR